MRRLVSDRRFYCVHTGHLKLAQPPLEYPDMLRQDFEATSSQGFSWYPNAIFFALRYGDAWLTASQLEQIEVSEASTRAILVPVEVPKDSYLNIGGDDRARTLALPPGQYKLLFELRELKDEELLSIDKYSVFDYPPETEGFYNPPELCTLTFVPTQEKVEPELLKFSDWGDTLMSGKRRSSPPERLVMFDEVLPDGWRTPSPAEIAANTTIPIWQPYIRDSFKDSSLKDVIDSLLESEPERAFSPEDIIATVFEADIPRPIFLDARRDVFNLLRTSARTGKWHRSGQFYSLSKAALDNLS